MALIRGTIVSFDSSTYLASVRQDGAQPTVITSVRTTRIADTEVAAGRRCIIDTGDHGDLLDVVIVAVYT